MKNIISKILSLSLLAVAFAGCERDYIAPEEHTRSFGIFGDYKYGDNINFAMEGELLALMDVSLGYRSHEWNILRMDGTEWMPIENYEVKYVRENSGITSSNKDDIEQFLMGDVPSKHTMKALLFFFDAPGKYNMQLSNTYDRPVEYIIQVADPIYGSTANRYFQSVPLSDTEHLAELGVIYLVYADLNATAKIYTDEQCTQELVFSEGTTANITKGTVLYAKDDLSGVDYELIDEREWSVKSTSLEEPLPAATIEDPAARVAKITFAEAGEFTLSLSQKREDLSPTALIGANANSDLATIIVSE